jgi:hypothetical protein
MSSSEAVYARVLPSVQRTLEIEQESLNEKVWKSTSEDYVVS